MQCCLNNALYNVQIFSYNGNTTLRLWCLWVCLLYRLYVCTYLTFVYDLYDIHWSELRLYENCVLTFYHCFWKTKIIEERTEEQSSSLVCATLGFLFFTLRCLGTFIKYVRTPLYASVRFAWTPLLTTFVRTLKNTQTIQKCLQRQFKMILCTERAFNNISQGFTT